MNPRGIVIQVVATPATPGAPLTPHPPPHPEPLAPSRLRPEPTQKGIKLIWDAAEAPDLDPVKHYEVWRWNHEMPSWTCIDKISANKHDCFTIDKRPYENNDTCHYIVRGVNEAGPGEWSETIAVNVQFENEETASANESTEPEILQHFDHDHLPPGLAQVSNQIRRLAHTMNNLLPDSAEKGAGLRKLLEAKDCFVRARNQQGEPQAVSRLEN